MRTTDLYNPVDIYLRIRRQDDRYPILPQYPGESESFL